MFISNYLVYPYRIEKSILYKNIAFRVDKDNVIQDKKGSASCNWQTPQSDIRYQPIYPS
jgi:hypothetical protein